MMEAQRVAGVDGGGGGGSGEGQSSFSKRWTRIKCPIKWRGKKKGTNWRQNKLGGHLGSHF